MKNIAYISVTAVALFIAPLPVQAADEVLTFSASGAFSNGDSLGGTVTIDVTTGNVTAAALTATGPDNELFNTNAGQITGYPVAGDTVIAADSPNNGNYPVALLAVAEPNLIGYLGGSLGSTTSPANGYPSDYVRADNSSVALVSGALTLLTPNKIVTFDAYGAFNNGDILGGSVVIDTTTGNVIKASLTATGPDNETFNTNVGQITGYPVAGDTVITADSPNSGNYPVALLAIAAPNLIGYGGGSLGSTSALANGYASDYVRSDNSSVSLAAGGLVAAPEPSCVSLVGSGFVLAVAACRRRRRRR